jgi:hypothetical protein
VVAVGRLLSTKLNNSAHATLNSHAYGYNVGSQRTNQSRADGSSVNYTYDSLVQLKTALGYENGGAARLHEKLGYLYDAAGNLSKRTNNALVQTFGVNNLNQLTAGTRSNTLTVAGTTTGPATKKKVSGPIISYFSLSFRSRYRKVPVPAIVESCLDCPAGDCGFRLRASADCAPTLSSLVFNSRSGDQKGVPDIDTDSAGG